MKFKKGDKVILKPFTGQSSIGWNEEMEKYIGQEVELLEPHGTSGFKIKDDWIWRIGCMEPVPQYYEIY